MRTAVPVLLFLTSMTTSSLMLAQSPYVSVLGTVEKVDAGAISIKTAKGDASTVKFSDQTTFLKMAAGETDTKKATPGAMTDVAVGDSVIARVLTADPTGKPARTIYIEKKEDLASRRDKTAEEWKTATAGLVTSVDPAAIKISSKGKEITINVSGKVQYSLYNPENGKYEPGALADVKMGSQVRVLGPKSADGAEIKATDLGTGTFKTIGVQVKTIDVAGKSITGLDTASKANVTIAIRTDTELRKFNDMSAMMVARQLNPSYQQAGRGGRGGGGAPGGGAPAGAGGDGAPGGGRGMGGGRGRGMDVSKIIEQQPTIQLTELKPGDAIIVTGATGASTGKDKVYANALVAGAEQILRAAANSGADPLAGSWNMGGGGGGDN